MTKANQTESISPGTRLGKYEVVHRIAFGGMAEIYLARSSGIEGFEKYVVLKRILPQLAVNAELVRMFLKEARVAAALDHANIAQVHDIGEERGIYFFTMEYLHGEDVRWIARRLERRGERMPVEHALAVAIGAASGLHFAHDKTAPDGRNLGIVHRDVSPSNIVVTYEGGVKVVDFGVAKLSADPDLSRRHALKGKLAYMSPEQLGSQEVDRRSDVFSLGVVLYEMTTRARLFGGGTEVQTMRRVLDGTIPPPSERVPGYPPELERIVMRALDRDAGRRHQTARELQLDLEAFARDRRLRVSSAAVAEWMERTFGRKRELWHTLGTARAGAGTTTAAALPLRRRPTPAAELTAATHAFSRRPDAGGPIEAATGSALALGSRSGSMRRARRRALAALAVAGMAVAGGGGALAVRATHGPPAGTGPGSVEAGRPDPAPVVLVAEKGSVAVDRGPGMAPAPASPVSGPAPRATAAEPVVAASGHAAARRPRPAAGARGGGGGETFSATFARHQPELRRCIFGATEQAAGAGEISLRFQAARDGHVTAISVLPAALGATPLGACLATVGGRIVFAPQPEPVTFRIPLTVHLQADPKPRR